MSSPVVAFVTGIAVHSGVGRGDYIFHTLAYLVNRLQKLVMRDNPLSLDLLLALAILYGFTVISWALTFSTWSHSR